MPMGCTMVSVFFCGNSTKVRLRESGRVLEVGLGFPGWNLTDLPPDVISGRLRFLSSDRSTGARYRLIEGGGRGVLHPNL